MKITLLALSLSLTSQAKALALCEYPIKWVDQQLCLDTSADTVQNDLKKMTSLLEGEINREEHTEFPVYFADKGEFVSKKKLKKALSVLSSMMEKKKYAEFLQVHRSLELNYVEMIPYHYPVNAEIMKAIRVRFSPEEAQGESNATQSLPSLRKDAHDISKLDLKLGFNRKPSELPDGKNCKYDEAKTNYGTHPGFTLKCSKLKVKVKFGEYHSEAFASRIFWALGFTADPVDYLPNVILPYDRRVFTEFNSRRLMKTRFIVGPFLTKELPIAVKSDPFKFIQGLELKDGTIVSGRKNLRKFLVGGSKEKTITEDLIIKENEKQIVKIHTGPVQAQIDEDSTTFGPWSWSEFGVQDSSEARSTLLLAAWLNWFDCRLDNNRLRLVDGKLVHVISDLGGVLGNAGGNIPFLNSVEELKAFEDHFISFKNDEIRFPHYRPLNTNEAFNRATFADLAPMAELILKLSPAQIRDALEVSGFSETEVEGFHFKLLKRQEEIREAFTVSKP